MVEILVVNRIKLRIYKATWDSETTPLCLTYFLKVSIELVFLPRNVKSGKLYRHVRQAC